MTNPSTDKTETKIEAKIEAKITTKKSAGLLKAQVKRSDFLDLVSQAHSLIEKRSIIPILSKLLIQAKKGVLHIHATDQDNSLQGDLPAQVEKPGEVVVDSQSLFDILKELEDGDVHLSEHSGKKFRLSQGAAVFNLLGMSAQDFPAFPPFKIQKPFLIPAGVLKNLLDKTSYCSSVDETRYHLNGVFFETVSHSSKVFFRFTATDTHRLALAEQVCEKPFLKQGVIIPRKGVQEIRKLISYNEEGDIECSVELPRILFRRGKTVLSIKLVEGNYPNYQRLIPEKSSLKVTVQTESFGQALKRVSLLSGSRFKAVTLDIKDKKACMKAEDSELGSAQDESSIEKKEGSDLTVRFNARYLLEAINSLDKDKIVLELNGSSSACLIRPADSKKQDFRSLSIIMPMTL